MIQPETRPLLTRRRTILIMSALMTGTFLTALDQTVVGTAMPTIVGQLGGLELYSWVFTSYLLTSTTTVPLWGKLADLYGRLPIFYTGVALFLIASALCGMAQSMEQLVLFRALQGLGGGAVQPLVLTMIGDVFTVEQRARFNALFSAVWGVASVAGPAVGGVLTDAVSWRFVFYINLPFGALACFMLARYFPERIERRPHQLDLAGAGLLMGAITSLLLATSTRGGGIQADTPVTVGLVAASLALFGAFIWAERRAPEPVVPLGLFTIPAIGVAAVTTLLVGGLQFATTTYLPLMVQGAYGGTATTAGAMLIPLSIGWPLGSVASGRIILRWGFRPALLCGVVFIALGSVPLAFINNTTSIWLLAFLTGVTGLGLGFATLATTIAVQNSVDWSRRGVATSVVLFCRSMGGSVAVTAMGALLAADLTGRLQGLQLPGADRLTMTEVTALLEPSVRATFDPATVHVLETALDASLHLVYGGIAVLAVLAVLAALRYPRVTVDQLGNRPARPAEGQPAVDG